jgi:hypothetical protein
MSYFNHISFALFTLTICVSPLNAQTTKAASTQNQDGIEFYYFPSGNDNTTCDFDISFAINDSQIKDAYFSMFTDLKAVIEYQDLTQSQKTSFTPVMAPKAFKNVGEYFFGEVKLEGLKANTAYRARISFVAPQPNGTFAKVGTTSKWYYSVTTGEDTQEIARAQRLLKKFHDTHAHLASIVREAPSTAGHHSYFTSEDVEETQAKASVAFLSQTTDPVLVARTTQITLTITQ